MSEHEKTNHVASNGKPPAVFSAEAVFADGAGLSPEAGGVISDNGEYYSVARQDMVPDGRPSEKTESGWNVPANRVGRISILKNRVSIPTTYGMELEVARLDQEGHYTDLPDEGYLKASELYTFMNETGTEPTDSPDEFKNKVWEMVTEEVSAAEAAGQLTAAVAVYGQKAPSPEQANPSIYVRETVEAMNDRTGFDTVQIFRVGSAQGHTGGSRTESSIAASEAMEYLQPILDAPTLSGPLLYGQPDLLDTVLTEKQRAHLDRVGVNSDDLSGPYQSWRYLLRRIGSPSAGIWMEPAPNSLEEYRDKGTQKLASGSINNIDRFFGWHTTRIRTVLNESGANTRENCTPDTMLGNPDTLATAHLLESALFTRLEAMHMRGRDPVLAVASMLGTASMPRQARLDYAHRLVLRETSRYGNDAIVYGNKQPGEWLGALLEIADEAPYTRLAQDDRLRLRRMYANWNDTAGALQQWCIDHHTDTPTAQAYFDLGINNPAVYMEEHHEELRRRRPGDSNELRTRQVELGAARALHRAVKLQNSHV